MITNSDGDKKHMTQEKQEKLIPVEVGNIGEIVLPEIDLKKYVGKTAKIISAGVFKSTFGLVVKVETMPLGKEGKGEKGFDIKASRMFGLQEDENGVLGWGVNTELGKFLASKKVKHYKDLVGKEVVVQVNPKKPKFLSFV